MAPGVRDFDPEGTGRRVQREGQAEVTTLYAAVQRRVGGEFGNDLFRPLRHARWHRPGAQLLGGKRGRGGHRAGWTTAAE